MSADEELQVHGEAGERVTILQVGRATLEPSNPAQVEMIDRVEVDRKVSPADPARPRGGGRRGRHRGAGRDA